MQIEAENAINGLSPNCQQQLGSKWNLTNGPNSLIGKVDPNNPNADTFYDGTSAAVSGQTMASSGWTGPGASTTTVGSFFAGNTTTYGFTSIYNGGAGNQIVLGALFFTLSPAMQAAGLLHEVLHTYTGLNDINLAGALGLGAFKSISAASSAITGYLDNNCYPGVS
jgi:hypothetical protein